MGLAPGLSEGCGADVRQDGVHLKAPRGLEDPLLRHPLRSLTN